MSTQSERWKKWEGRVVNEKFPLRQWLGGSDHSAVFLTELTGPGSQKAALKLIAAANLDEEAQLSRWTAAAKFSHPHVIRLFDAGRCVIDDTPLLYCVMEFADEDLAQVLPVRPLSPEEASDMLKPTAEALSSLYRAGLAHGSIKPSNIMAAANQLKLSADTLGKTSAFGAARIPSAYDAPEIATTGPSPAADVWSLGATLVAVLTQNEPNLSNGSREPVTVPDTIPQPLREIARDCLRDEQHRCAAENILKRLQPATPSILREVKPPRREVNLQPPPQRSKRWVVVTVIALALVIGVWLAIRVLSHQAPAPVADTLAPAQPQSASSSAEQTPSPSANQSPAQKAATRGSVRQQIMPEVSRGAQNTITGRVKVTVQVTAEASGNVSDANLVSPGPSKYFAARSLAAARQWKFNAPLVGGRASSSVWSLRFEIGRSSIQAFPTQTKP